MPTQVESAGAPQVPANFVPTMLDLSRMTIVRAVNRFLDRPGNARPVARLAVWTSRLSALISLPVARHPQALWWQNLMSFV